MLFPQAAKAAPAQSIRKNKVWDYFTGKQQDLYHELVEQYNRSQDRYKVVTEYIPFNEVKKQLSVGTAGNAMPDAVFLDNVDNASFAAMGVLEDLTEKIEQWGQADQFYEGLYHQPDMKRSTTASLSQAMRLPCFTTKTS